MYGKYIFGENLIKHHIKIICYTSGDIVSSALLFIFLQIDIKLRVSLTFQPFYKFHYGGAQKKVDEAMEFESRPPFLSIFRKVHCIILSYCRFIN